jgi:hypothetical protein
MRSCHGKPFYNSLRSSKNMFTVYDAVQDRASWRKTLAKLPAHARDIYADPDYISLFSFEPGTRGTCVVFERGKHLWLHAFLLQPIGADRFDIETAYGYGGPSSNTQDSAFLTAAQAAYTEWLTTHGVIAEFLRLHPLIENRAFVNGTIERDRTTCSIDLTKPVQFNSKVQNMLNRARKAGVDVQRVSAVDHVDTFHAMYDANMAALDADSFYRFDRDFFANLAPLLDRQGVLLAAVLEGRWVAASMFLHAKPYLHYYLSAMDLDARVPGTVNLLLNEAALIGQTLGCERFHLGGGRTATEKDSLLLFKKSVCTDEHDFHISKRVVDPEGYAAICDAWRHAHPEMAERYGHRILCYRYFS